MTSKLDPSVAPDTSQGPALLAVTAMFLFLALLCYTARMYVRIRVLHYPWWDDWIISVATVPRPLFEKITFVALTSLGLLASAAALAKVVLLARVSSSDGGMWTEVSPVDLSVWTNVEECLGIAAASIPVLKPMLDRVLGRLGVRPQAYGARELRGT
ncbi:hypothetical protein FQN53_007964 [Emmonsiellopsis sp. PD_33]|nr:hypothetical protein FQN53_007964 [Emmonsiellopsis sp. PD_33]